MPHSRTSWKNLEKKVSKKLGGTRVNRALDYSQSLPDVIQDFFLVECKYLIKASEFYLKLLVLSKNDKGVVLIHKDRVIMLFSYFCKYLQDEKYREPIYHVMDPKKKYRKFYEDALAQVRGYIEAEGRIPLVVVKKGSVIDELVYLDRKDWEYTIPKYMEVFGKLI